MKYLGLLIIVFSICQCKSIRPVKEQAIITSTKEDINQDQAKIKPCLCEGQSCDSMINCIYDLCKSVVDTEALCTYSCIYDEATQNCAYLKAINGNMRAHKVVLTLYDCQFRKFSKPSNQAFLSYPSLLFDIDEERLHLLQYPKKLLNLRGEDAFLVQMNYFSMGINTRIDHDVFAPYPFLLLNNYMEKIIKKVDGRVYTTVGDLPNYQRFIREPYKPIRKVNDELDRARFAAHKALMEYYHEGKLEFYKYGEPLIKTD